MKFLFLIAGIYATAFSYAADNLPDQLCRRALSSTAEIGEAQFHHLAKIFTNPAESLKGARTTGEEDLKMARLAFQRLIANRDGANSSHVMDLILAAQDPEVQKAFTEAGISPLEMMRNILLHDLGKQYGDPLLDGYRAFLEQVFPDKNFLNTGILPHEFGSMIILAELAKEAGISPDKVPRLQALLAGHNAGYRPNLKGTHFWVNAWPQFAKAMRSAGIPLPEIYGPVLHEYEGGDKETVGLTSLDRGVSVTLASQAKFSMVLVNGGKWSTGNLVELFRGNVDNVPREVDSVLSRLPSYVGHEKAGKIRSALTLYFRTKAEQTAKLADNLEAMAKVAPPPEGIEGSSVPYRTIDGEWYRVNGTGQGSKWDGKKWEPVPAMTGTKAQTPEFFFGLVFKDIRYAVPKLELPEALK